MIPTILLCGGTGTRLREQTELRPKPLIQLGGKPLIYYIMKLYAHYGHTEFILALGYMQETFKEYFAHFDEINNDVCMRTGRYRGAEYNETADDWDVVLSDTGKDTFKGGRLKRVEKYVKGDTFFLSYGDGLSDINLDKLLAFHEAHGKMISVTGVHPTARFGELHHEGSKVISFAEKPDNDNYLVSGGFMVMNRQIFDYLTPDAWCDLEAGTMELLAAKDELRVYEHKGFWRCVDTLKDLGDLQFMCDKGEMPWVVWKGGSHV